MALLLLLRFPLLLILFTATEYIPLRPNQDDNLYPILTSSPSTPTLLPTHKQDRQTNQTTFSNSHPPTDLLITQGDGSIRILDYPSFNALHSFSAHTSSCLAIAYSPTGNYVAVGGSDAMISLWDTKTWVCKRTVSGSAGSIRGLSWSWDGRYLVGASDEGVGSNAGGSGGDGVQGLDIYHAESGDVVHTVPLGSGAVAPAVAWHPNRYCLAYTVTEDGRKGSGSGLKIVGGGEKGTM